MKYDTHSLLRTSENAYTASPIVVEYDKCSDTFLLQNNGQKKPRKDYIDLPLVSSARLVS